MVAADISRGKRKARVKELRETVGLTDCAHHKPEELREELSRMSEEG